MSDNGGFGRRFDCAKGPSLAESVGTDCVMGTATYAAMAPFREFTCMS